jgi:hypothetical protein
VVYGVSDSLEVLGVISLKVGEPGRHIVVDIGQRVQELLRGNPWGLDPDPGHWQENGVYAGSYTNGEARIRSLQGLFAVGF